MGLFYKKRYMSHFLTHSFAMHLFSTPWKHQKTVRFSDVFTGLKKGALGTNGLNTPLRNDVDCSFDLFIVLLLNQSCSSFLENKKCPDTEFSLFSNFWHLDRLTLPSKTFYDYIRHVYQKSTTRGCLCDNWKPSFLPRLIFNWRTFSRRVTARWWRQWAKNQIKCVTIRTRELGGVRL